MTTAHYSDESVRLYHGDCIEVMRQLPDASVDAVVTDPPYELGFMGKHWDGSGIAYNVDLWRDALRVLKPGGHLLAFGGTRTWHRLACAIEDAGFEVRDNVAYLHDGGLPGPMCWVYGQGFPKSHNLPGGLGTALKPAFEPVVVARKPLVGTVAANVERYGTGALNIDGGRVGMSDEDADFIRKTARPNTAGQQHTGDVMNRPSTPTVNVNPAGRWPANVILDESQAAELDRQSGVSAGQVGMTKSNNVRNFGVVGVSDVSDEVQTFDYGTKDFGGASRFFYTAKADSSERPRVDGVAHPTVKPLDLMRYLVRLVTPPGGVVLEPFAGSGTTLEACIVEGFRCIGIEREADYIPLIMARITKPIEVTLL